MINPTSQNEATRESESLRFPTGEYVKPANITIDILNQNISVIGYFPDQLIREVSQLTKDQLDTQYRPDGWTIRQVIHHCADSHINMFTRIKLALTEDKPIIKPFSQDQWAMLPDTIKMPIEPSLQLLKYLHARCVFLLKSLTYKDWSRSFIHPELKDAIQLNEYVGRYAWHCNHHLAHITTLKKSKAWK